MNFKFLAFTFLVICKTTNASECFVRQTCLKNVSNCRVSINLPYYSPYDMTLESRSQFSYEWKQELECTSFNGRISRLNNSGNEIVFAQAIVPIETIRIPSNIREVDQEDIQNANRHALEICEQNRISILETYQFCK